MKKDIHLTRSPRGKDLLYEYYMNKDVQKAADTVLPLQIWLDYSSHVSVPWFYFIYCMCKTF